MLVRRQDPSMVDLVRPASVWDEWCLGCHVFFPSCCMRPFILISFFLPPVYLPLSNYQQLDFSMSYRMRPFKFVQCIEGGLKRDLGVHLQR